MRIMNIENGRSSEIYTARFYRNYAKNYEKYLKERLHQVSFPLQATKKCISIFNEKDLNKLFSTFISIGRNDHLMHVERNSCQRRIR